MTYRPSRLNVSIPSSSADGRYYGRYPSGNAPVSGTTVATPTFSPAAGTYTATQVVSLACATDGASIYYTTDGSTPTTASAVYSSPLVVNTYQTLKAIAVAAGLANSAVGSAGYSVSAPVCSQNGSSSVFVNTILENLTATGGSTTTIVDTSQSWTVNQWVGYTAQNTTNNIGATIVSNTATTLTFAAMTTANASGNGYQIFKLNQYQYVKYGNYFGQTDDWGPQPGVLTEWFNSATCMGASITNNADIVYPHCFAGNTRGWVNNPNILNALSANGSTSWTTDCGMGVQVSALTKCKIHLQVQTPQALGQSRTNTLIDVYMHQTPNPSATGGCYSGISIFPTQMDQASGSTSFYGGQLANSNGFNITIGGVQYSCMVEQSQGTNQTGGYYVQLFVRPTSFSDTGGTMPLLWGVPSCTHDLKAILAYFNQTNPVDDSGNPIKFGNTWTTGHTASPDTYSQYGPWVTKGQVVTGPLFPPSTTYLNSINAGFELNYTLNPTTDQWLLKNFWVAMQGENDGPLDYSATAAALIGTATTQTSASGTLSTAIRLATSASDTTSAAGTLAGSGRQPLGMNFAAISYSSPEQVFNNIIKQAGTNGPSTGSGLYATETGWFSSYYNSSTGAVTLQTNEPGSLVKDADGYVETMPSSSASNAYSTIVYWNLPAVPGLTNTAPPGSYTVQFSGTPTILVIEENTQALLATITASGQTFTYNPANGGLQFTVIAQGTGSNYLTNFSVCLTSNLAAFSAGSIFTPTFVSAFNNHSLLRFMDWGNINYELQGWTLSGGSSSTLTAGVYNLNMDYVWPYQSQTRNIYFTNGDIRSATFTYNSAYVSWGTATSSAVSQTVANQNCYCHFWVSWRDSFANRSKPSNCFYSTIQGVPLEVQVALGNLFGADIWVNFPLMMSSADRQATCALVANGTGAQSGFAALTSPQRMYGEVHNEVWNTAGAIANGYDLAGCQGGAMWPSQSPGGGNESWNANYYGMTVALMANDCQTVWASSFSRCIPVMGSQSASYNAGRLDETLTTAYWPSGPASNYPIKAAGIAPYFMESYPYQGDVTYIAGLSDPTAELISLLTSQTGASGRVYNDLQYGYPSVPATGWFGQIEGEIQAYVTYLANNHPTINLVGYEGGPNFLYGNPPTSWATIATNFYRDPRITAVITTFLSTIWKGITGGGVNNTLCWYDSTGVINYGEDQWGEYENLMQYSPTLANLPPKAQAIKSYTG